MTFKSLKTVFLLIFICCTNSYLRANSCLNNPIGKIIGRNSADISDCGSTLGVNLNCGSNVTLSDLDKLAKLGISWAQIRPHLKDNNQINWEHSDLLVDGLCQRKIKIMGHLGGISKPLSNIKKPAIHEKKSSVWVTPTSSQEALASYISNVAQFVSRYKDRIKYWEIWNEVDSKKFWPPEPNATEYIKLFNITRKVILDIQNDAKIISGSLTLKYNSPFIDEFIKHNVINSCDIFGLHPPRHLPEYGDACYPHIEDYTKLMQKLKNSNPNIQIWDTEIQALTGINSGNNMLDFQDHAKILLRRFIVEKQLGYQCTLWQMFKGGKGFNHPGQLLDTNSVPNEKYYALRNLGAWLDNNIEPTDEFSVAYDKQNMKPAKINRLEKLAKTLKTDCTENETLIIPPSCFHKSIKNKNTKTIDLFYINVPKEIDLNYSIIIKCNSKEWRHYNHSQADCKTNINTWFLHKKGNSKIFVSIPKNANVNEYKFEITDIEQQLQAGNSVKIPPSMLKLHGKDPLRYRLEPIKVSPSGISFDLIVNNETWPYAKRGLDKLKPKQCYTFDCSKLVLITPEDFDLNNSKILLTPPNVPFISIACFKNKLTELPFITYWQNTYPNKNINTGEIDITITLSKFKKLKNWALIDLLSGNVYDLSAKTNRTFNKITFHNLPLNESPFLITEKSAIKFE